MSILKSFHEFGTEIEQDIFLQGLFTKTDVRRTKRGHEKITQNPDPA